MTDELKCLAHPCDGVMKPNTYDASLTCSACQFQVADESEYAALVAGRQAAIDDEKQNPWKAAIIQELIVDNILTEELERDPRTALAAAIDWNCKVALDPSVSKEAQDLQQRAIDAALEDIEGALNADGRYDSADFVRLHKGTNPLAERDARIAELERERDRAIQQHERCAEKLFNAERELDELREDVGRYRWLRDEDNWGDDTENRWAILGELTHGEFDNWIDAAMRQEEE